MQRLLSSLIQVLGVTALVVALAIGFLMLADLAGVGSSQERAGWVQAVGSIAAILAAIWIARDDIQRAKTSREEEDRR